MWRSWIVWDSRCGFPTRWTTITFWRGGSEEPFLSKRWWNVSENLTFNTDCFLLISMSGQCLLWTTLIECPQLGLQLRCRVSQTLNHSISYNDIHYRSFSYTELYPLLIWVLIFIKIVFIVDYRFQHDLSFTFYEIVIIKILVRKLERKLREALIFLFESSWWLN